jgi:hypothetical protein
VFSRCMSVTSASEKAARKAGFSENAARRL